MRFRIYIDTSIIGGCFDKEFSTDSQRLLDMAKQGKITLLVSDILLEELSGAPQKVREALSKLPIESVEQIIRNEDSYRLHKAYLEAGILSASSENDAHHVALATIVHADVIVSWNFSHIVNFRRIRLFNAVNLKEGYSLIDIRSPKEIGDDYEIIQNH